MRSASQEIRNVKSVLKSIPFSKPGVLDACPERPPSPITVPASIPEVNTDSQQSTCSSANKGTDMKEQKLTLSLCINVCPVPASVGGASCEHSDNVCSFRNASNKVNNIQEKTDLMLKQCNDRITYLDSMISMVRTQLESSEQVLSSIKLRQHSLPSIKRSLNRSSSWP